jgi:hypothetical protein
MKFIKVFSHTSGFMPVDIWQEDEFSNEYFFWTSDGFGDSPSYKDYLWAGGYKSLEELETE